ncbi:hypothetical protein [Tsukamurella pseudospumae]|uniref:Uncharacterized protein n=1 Tax=Tsukamurella pseudospumae TaxID=239498 RepID=A0A138A3G3_9ACTN|nr:hypothetical protein [Tsukamurella pseudospumae]KXO98643.1 hypothetical protein AXK61_03430 [Tsukamurella pseudospumae]KXP04963.1 hypothetical protein AXK60_12375 [Tsukamurella pseudospumae]
MLSGPLVTLVVGLAGVAGVLATLGQRTWSETRDRAHRISHDARTEWWCRYQWAAEQANQQENVRAQEFGKAVMSALTDESPVTDSELAILAAVAARLAMMNTDDDSSGGAT